MKSSILSTLLALITLIVLAALLSFYKSSAEASWSGKKLQIGVKNKNIQKSRPAKVTIISRNNSRRYHTRKSVSSYNRKQRLKSRQNKNKYQIARKSNLRFRRNSRQRVYDPYYWINQRKNK